jgi:hypothetical protein
MNQICTHRSFLLRPNLNECKGLQELSPTRLSNLVQLVAYSHDQNLEKVAKKPIVFRSILMVLTRVLNHGLSRVNHGLVMGWSRVRKTQGFMKTLGFHRKTQCFRSEITGCHG